MAHKATGLSAIPRRESIGAEARVHHGHMALVTWVHQVPKERKELIGCQHAFVNDDVGRQRAHVEEVRLSHALVFARQMSTVLANRIQLALKGFVFHAADSTLADEQLLEGGHCGASGLADIGDIRVGGQFAPADQSLACVINGLFDDGFAASTLDWVRGQENIADTVFTEFW